MIDAYYMLYVNGRWYKVPSGVPETCAAKYYSTGELTCGCTNPTCPWNPSYIIR